MPNKIRSNRVSRVLWMVFQTACTLAGTWAGATMPSPDMSRPAFIVTETVIGFFLGITLTVVWAMLFELFRYTIPGLVRRGAQKVHRRQPF